MPYELFLALRHLRSRQKRRLARVTWLVAVIGIAVGVAALIVALALANGFRDEMRDKILRGTAHVTVMRSDGQAMTEYKQIAARVGSLPGVVSATGTTYDGALVIGKRASAYAVLRGVDSSSTHATADIGRTLIAGSVEQGFSGRAESHDLPAAVVGSELATRTGLHVGDVAEIIAARAGTSSATGAKRQVRVAGIFRSGLFEYDSTWIYLPLETASVLSGETHVPPSLAFKLQTSTT